MSSHNDSSFTPTERRLDVTCRRHPAFPRNPAVLVRLVRHVQRRIRDDANGVLRPYGLNYPEYNLLMMMYGADDRSASPSQLADEAGEKSTNITRLSNRLLAMGLIARTSSEADRRKLVLSLTDAGVALLDTVLPAIRQMLLRHTSQLQASEQQQLEYLLKKMLVGVQSE